MLFVPDWHKFLFPYCCTIYATFMQIYYCVYSWFSQLQPNDLFQDKRRQYDLEMAKEHENDAVMVSCDVLAGQVYKLFVSLLNLLASRFQLWNNCCLLESLLTVSYLSRHTRMQSQKHVIIISGLSDTHDICWLRTLHTLLRETLWCRNLTTVMSSYTDHRRVLLLFYREFRTL